MNDDDNSQKVPSNNASSDDGEQRYANKPYIPPDTDLLDKKIGTFDTTPFAPPKNVANSPKPPTNPVTPIPTQNKPVQVNSYTPKPSINSGIAPRQFTPTNQPAPKQPITLVPRKPSPIPLQNISTPTNKPPTKTQPLKPVQNIQVQQNTPKEAEFAKPLRTYEGDVAEVMSHRRTSSASIAIAESKRQKGEEKIGNTETSHAGRKLILLLLSIILIGGGLIGAYYLYSISPLAPLGQIAPQNQAVQSIVPSDTQIAVLIDTQNSLGIQSKIRSEVSKTQKTNSIKEIIPAIKNETGGTVRISAPEMMSALDIDAPDILRRSLGNNWMSGVYNDANNDKSFFIVVTSTFFQNTFAGMLQWEQTMADDLKQYLYSIEPAGISNASVPKETGRAPYVNPLDNLNSILPSSASSSVATSTSTNGSTTTTESVDALRPYVTVRGKFEDRIIKNKDVREFRTDAGTILFLYSFIDNNHLVITGDEATLTEILSRLEKQAFIR